MNYSADNSYQELEAYFNEVISQSVVLDPAKELTLFDVSNYSHYENVISNWYAFFFDSTAEHSLGELFVSSLISIINETNDEFYMNGYDVEREFYTDNGGRIDILLYKKTEEHGKFESAIIVENKIFADIYNNLGDYYQSIDVESENKIGVVLTLREEEIGCKDFINITHNRLAETIKGKLGEYFVSAPPRYLHYLQDFFSNLEQLAMPGEMPDNVKFYFDQAEKIGRLIDLRSDAFEFVRNSLHKTVREEFDSDWSWVRKYGESVTLQYSNSGIYCYIYYSQAFEEKKYRFEVWLKDKNTLDLWRKSGGQECMFGKFGGELPLKKDDLNNEYWLELGRKEYNILNIGDIENFGNHVLENIQKDWSKFLMEVKEILRKA